MCKELIREFWKAAACGPKLYFVPLVGAYRHTRREWRKAYRELSEDLVMDAGASQK
jgi:hypothetical protein